MPLSAQVLMSLSAWLFSKANLQGKKFTGAMDACLSLVSITFKAFHSTLFVVREKKISCETLLIQL